MKARYIASKTESEKVAIRFLIGNVFKYCYRYRNKNGLEDLKKAAWYLDRAIKEIEDETK